MCLIRKEYLPKSWKEEGISGVFCVHKEEKEEVEEEEEEDDESIPHL